MKMTTRIHSDVPTIRGFTLVELLIVISVIAILIAIVLAASKGVVGRQKERVTQNLLIALDRALDEYKTEVGAFPVYDADAYKGVPGPDNELTNFPKAAGGDGEEHPARPDVAVFIAQVSGFGEVDSVLKEIPGRFSRITSAKNLDQDQQDLTPSYVDGWAEKDWPASEDPSKPYPIRQQQVIYYVHPENVLAQALYGQCASGRPYFVSAGADKQYGLGGDSEGRAYQGETDEQHKVRLESYLKDNLYSYKGVGAANTDKTFFDSIRKNPGL